LNILDKGYSSYNEPKHERGRSFGKVKNIVSQAINKMKPINSKQLRYSRERAEANKVAVLAKEIIKGGSKSHSTRGNSQDNATA